MSSIFNNNLENIVYLRQKSIFATKTQRHEEWSIELKTAGTFLLMQQTKQILAVIFNPCYTYII
jgi:hypothetical protein